jgi:hypothetical protein
MLPISTSRPSRERLPSTARVISGSRAASDHIEGHLCASISRSAYSFNIGLNFACDCNRYNALTASRRDGFINHLHQVR